MAQHMEIAPSQDSGLVTGRDRGLAARDHRDSLRALARQSGGGHQGRRGGNSGLLGRGAGRSALRPPSDPSGAEQVCEITDGEESHPTRVRGRGKGREKGGPRGGPGQPPGWRSRSRRSGRSKGDSRGKSGSKGGSEGKAARDHRPGAPAPWSPARIDETDLASPLLPPRDLNAGASPLPGSSSQKRRRGRRVTFVDAAARSGEQDRSQSARRSPTPHSEEGRGQRRWRPPAALAPRRR